MKEPIQMICFVCENQAMTIPNTSDWKESLKRIRCDYCGDFRYDRNFEHYLDLDSPNNPKLINLNPSTLEKVRIFLTSEIQKGNHLSGIALAKFLNS